MGRCLSDIVTATSDKTVFHGFIAPRPAQIKLFLTAASRHGRLRSNCASWLHCAMAFSDKNCFSQLRCVTAASDKTVSHDEVASPAAQIKLFLTAALRHDRLKHSSGRLSQSSQSISLVAAL